MTVADVLRARRVLVDELAARSKAKRKGRSFRGRRSAGRGARVRFRPQSTSPRAPREGPCPADGQRPRGRRRSPANWAPHAGAARAASMLQASRAGAATQASTRAGPAPASPHAHACAAELRVQPLEERSESLVVIDVLLRGPWHDFTVDARQPLWTAWSPDCCSLRCLTTAIATARSPCQCECDTRASTPRLHRFILPFEECHLRPPAARHVVVLRQECLRNAGAVRPIGAKQVGGSRGWGYWGSGT